MREHPEASRGCDDRRPSSVSQESAAPNPGHLSRPESVFSYQSNAAVSCTSWSSSSSEDTIAVKLGRRAASTDYGVIRPLPRNPLLILFTKDPDSSRRSIVAITIDDETKPNPERCNCRRFRDCRITALEQRRGRSPMLRAKRLANRAKWDLLPLAAAPNWSGLFRVSILFPTVEARHRFGGGYCECSLATEGDVDACVSSQHQGLLGIARVYYRRQMVLWQEQRDNQREVDDRPGQIK